jgi:type VI secretion system protein ImpG
MFDELHAYYNRELAYLRKLASDFAGQYPKVAGRLRLSGEAADDPHVERLLQGFAFIAARIHRKLDDDFPELTQGLLEVLYPHYLAPIPSLATIQLGAKPDLASPIEVPPGTLIDSGPVRGESCRFQTAYPVTLWPIVIESVSLSGRPIVAPANPAAAGAAGVLRLTLRCASETLTLSQLAPDRLRFFIRPQSPHAYKLYETVLNHAVSIALADHANDPSPVIRPASAICPVGFEPAESLLPYPSRSFIGYRLLTEYFAFPEKFLFFDLIGLSAKTLVSDRNLLEVFIYLNRTSVELERGISAENFALGCTPIVNLFRQRAEPIRLDNRSAEYRVVPDARRVGAIEVYAIESVTASAPDGRSRSFEPFFGVHHTTTDEPHAYWHASRHPADSGDGGTEVFLSFVDDDFDPAAPSDYTVSVETLCLNRDLPAKLPFGGGNPRLELVQASSAIAQILCISAPTPTLRPLLGRGTRWCLVSHLVLNHLSITGEADGADALRAILKLYDFHDSAQTRALIDSLRSVSAKPGIARVPSAGIASLCRGLDVQVDFDPGPFDNGQGFLLASVIERFFALYVSINSFSRTTARVRGRTDILRTWPPRAGSRVLL